MSSLRDLLYYEEPNVTLYLGDCVEAMRAMEANSVDAVVTDPPAGVAFMSKGWDTFRGRNDFVGFLTSVFTEAARVMKPGAHALIWALPRTSHWTAWAIEEAGLEVRDCIYHLFGSGFPKSADVSKHIDKAAGATREPGEPRMRLGDKRPYPWHSEEHEDSIFAERGQRILTAPATDEAKRWAGWGTALKPAAECWWLCRKPLSERNVAANVLRWNTGALNIDGSRIRFANEEDKAAAAAAAAAAQRAGQDQNAGRNAYGRFENGPASIAPYLANMDKGRWPANVILSHDERCERVGTKRVRGSAPASGPTLTGPSESVARGHFAGVAATPSYADGDGLETVEAWACVPSCPIAMVDAQSGELTSGSGVKAPPGKLHGFSDDRRSVRHDGDKMYSGDTGGASRYFKTFPDLAGHSRLFYSAKASRADRDGTRHPTTKPTDLMAYLVRLVAPPGGLVLDPFCGSGPTIWAAREYGFKAIGIDREREYLQDTVKRLRQGILL